MIPIRELLSRIRWDKEFGQGEFIIGYCDRVEDAIIRLPLQKILVRPDDHFAFDIIDQEGVLQSIPLHRIREVYKDSELIWHRNGARYAISRLPRQARHSMGHAFGYSCHGNVIKFVRKIGGRMIVRISIEGGVCHHR